jgi:protein tyrosine/serine phosphatase
MFSWLINYLTAGVFRPVIGALLLLALLAPAARAQGGSDGGPRYDELPNFHRVSERLYRGAQPRKGGFSKLASLGVNTVINLRGDDERAVAEEREARGAGLRYYNVPFKRLGRPTDAQIGRVLSLIEAPENGVVFVHCERGADRTGIVAAVYRISHDGWTSREAKREAKRYGMKFWQRGMKDYISDYYRDRPLRLNPPRDERRGRSVPPLTLRRSVLPRGVAVGVS